MKSPKASKRKSQLIALGCLVLAGVTMGIVLAVMSSDRSGRDWGSTPNISDVTKQSSSITYDPLRIDFAACEPGGGSVHGSFGSEHYLIEGRKGDTCVVYVGGETENPSWKGELTTTCRVPRSEGIQELSKVRRRYCNDAPNN